MRLFELAKRVAKFVWDNGDWYELMDSYGYDGYAEFESETIMGLCDKHRRKYIADYLWEMETETSVALAKEVCALQRKGVDCMDVKDYDQLRKLGWTVEEVWQYLSETDNCDDGVIEED